MNEIIKNIFD